MLGDALTLASIGETLRANKELIGIIVTSACLGLGGAKVARKNTRDHGTDNALISQVLDNQTRMHSENREDIHDLMETVDTITTWMTRHQALHDAYEDQRKAT